MNTLSCNFYPKKERSVPNPSNSTSLFPFEYRSITVNSNKNKMLCDNFFILLKHTCVSVRNIVNSISLHKANDFIDKIRSRYVNLK